LVESLSAMIQAVWALGDSIYHGVKLVGQFLLKVVDEEIVHRQE